MFTDTTDRENPDTLCRQYINYILASYKMKDLGLAKRFLGMDIEYGGNGTIKLHLKQHLSGLLERHGMQFCNPASTPMDSSVKLVAVTDGDGDGVADPKEYQQIIGEIQFASLVARPDISCAISTLSQFNIRLTSTQLTAAKRVLRYLKGSIDLGIVYSPPPGEATAFSDADWAGDLIKILDWLCRHVEQWSSILAKFFAANCGVIHRWGWSSTWISRRRARKWNGCEPLHTQLPDFAISSKAYLLLPIIFCCTTRYSAVPMPMTELCSIYYRREVIEPIFRPRKTDNTDWL